KVWEQSGWGALYRNRDYLSRAAFYDRAYVLPNDAAVRALMSSRWFTARRALLFSKEHLPTMPPLAVELPAVEIAARRLEGATSGVVGPDIACAAHIEKLRGWRGPGAEVRFRFGELPAGRYALAVEYVSAGDAPALVGAELRQSQMTHPAA